MPKKRRSTTRNTPPDGAVTPDLLAQLSATLWLPHDMDEGTRTARLAAARAMLADIAPAPGIESMLACQMVVTHLIAGGMTVALVVAEGPHRFSTEFWLLVLYWAGIAGWLLVPILVLGLSSVEMDPTFPGLCTRVSGVVAVLIPLFGLARLTGWITPCRASTAESKPSK